MTLKEVLSATAHYDDGSTSRIFTGYAAAVAALFMLGEQASFTLLEVTHRLNQVGFRVSDSTVSPRLHELKALGIISDSGPKRACKINHKCKKTWHLAEGARDLLTLKYTHKI